MALMFDQAGGSRVTGGPPSDEPATQTVVSDYTAILSGHSWNGPTATDTPAIVTYSFSAAPQPYLDEVGFSQDFIDSFVPFSAGDIANARNAIAQWADASGVIAIEVPAGQGDIQLGRFDFNQDETLAPFAGYAFYPHVTMSATSAFEDGIAGDIFVDTGSPGVDLALYLHEFGHAMGFKHPFEGDPTLDAEHDNKTFTVMSYTGPRTNVLGPFDIQAIQHLYGTQSEDGTHVASWSYNSATSTLTQTGGDGADTIRGTYGKDVISAAGGNDIVFGSFSDDNLEGNFGNDSVFGWDGDDKLKGGSGADRLDGGLGNDTFTFVKAQDSTGTSYDTIVGLDPLDSDLIDIHGKVRSINTLSGGALSTATFNDDLASAMHSLHFRPRDAVVFTADSGTLSGHAFLVVDLNHEKGYQVGQDLVVMLQDAVNIGDLDPFDFI